MKKIIALLLALVMCLGIFAGCGDEKSGTAGKNDTAGSGTEISSFNKLIQKTQSLNSFSAKMDIDMKMSVQGMTVEMPVTSNIKVKDAQGSKPVMYMDMHMSVMGQTVEAMMYQEDGWAYCVSGEQKYKLKNEDIDKNEDYSQQLGDLLQVLPEEIMNKASVRAKGDGNTVLTVSLEESDCQAIFGEYLKSATASVGDASVKSASVSITAKDGYLAVYELSLDMEAVVQGAGSSVNLKTTISFDDPSKAVDITPPEGYKDFPESNIG